MERWADNSVHGTASEEKEQFRRNLLVVENKPLIVIHLHLKSTEAKF